MTQVRVESFAISLDGYSAGPDHVAIAPILLGRGEPLFEGVDLPALGYECVQFAAFEKATHVVIRRRSGLDGRVGDYPHGRPPTHLA